MEIIIFQRPKIKAYDMENNSLIPIVLQIIIDDFMDSPLESNSVTFIDSFIENSFFPSRRIYRIIKCNALTSQVTRNVKANENDSYLIVQTIEYKSKLCYRIRTVFS